MDKTQDMKKKRIITKVWANSNNKQLAATIPKEMAESHNIKRGDVVEIEKIDLPDKKEKQQ